MPSPQPPDPEPGPIGEHAPAFQFDPGTLGQARAVMMAMGAAQRPPAPEDVVVSEHHVPGPPGAPDVRVLVSPPKAGGGNHPGILHVHGGGYVMGSAEMTVDSDAAYVQKLGAVVVSVDYRLAPETPHPGPVEDCYAALAWLHAQADSLGIDRKRIVVTGESAGGGLAAALVLLARDRGQIPVAF